MECAVAIVDYTVGIVDYTVGIVELTVVIVDYAVGFVKRAVCFVNIAVGFVDIAVGFVSTDEAFIEIQTKCGQRGHAPNFLMKRLLIYLFLAFSLSGTIFGQMPPGDLARWRAANYLDVKYKVNVTVEKNVPMMTGEVEITMTLTEEALNRDLILDWRRTQSAADKHFPYAFVTKLNMFESDIRTASVPMAKSPEGYLILPKNFLKSGENIIRISFGSPIKTSGAGVTRYIDKLDGAEYIYARFLTGKDMPFPVFDQPDLKARFRLSVVSVFNSSNYHKTVVTNTKLNNCNYSAYMVCTYAETEPISPNVFAFAAGDFATIELFSKTGTQKLYLRHTLAKTFKQYVAKFFQINRQTNKPELPKPDIILLPDIQFVQSEYDGIKFVSESAVFK